MRRSVALGRRSSSVRFAPNAPLAAGRATQKVVAPLEVLAQKIDAARSETLAAGKRLTSEHKTSVESVRRAQQRYFDAAAARADAVKLASGNERTARKADDAADKEAAARRECEAIVESARAFHTSYYAKELPDALRDANRALLEFGAAFGKLIAAYLAISRDVPKRRIALIDACRWRQSRATSSGANR